MALLLVLAAGANPAAAQRVENGVAVFAALDKVTAKISRLEIKLNETATFGALRVTPRACYSRPSTEQPKTSTFIEVNEVQLDGKENRIFSGWMFAESPGLNAVEHPVFDLWLTECVAPLRQPGVAAANRPPPRSGQTGQPGQEVVQQPPPPPEPVNSEFRRRRPR